MVIDPADRAEAAAPVAWAVDRLAAALSLRPAIGARPGKRCAAASVAMPPPPESLALVETSFDGRRGVLASGADTRGLTYALLELADRIRCGRPEAALNFGAAVYFVVTRGTPTRPR